MLAHDRLKLLSGRLSADLVDAAAAELGRIARQAGWEAGPGARVFEETIDAVRVDGSMVGDLVRARGNLRSRIVDEQTHRRLTSLEDRIALGVTTDGELSAAVFAYPDESFLVLVDHALMLCSWFVAQIAACTGTADGTDAGSIDVSDAVAAIRLALVRPAVGARAGPLPPLVLSEGEMALAASLTSEMDQFLLAHELAHVLLGHFTKSRTVLGALVGPSTPSDTDIGLEHAADLLALTLVLDDIDQGSTGSEHLPVRLAGIRLSLVLIDLYERTTFALQPSSHPSAADRFEFLRRHALEPWFGKQLSLLLAPLAGLVEALVSPPPEDLAFAAGRVDRGLAGRLDRSMWDPTHWAELGQLGGLVQPTYTTARRALRHAFPADRDGDRGLAELLAGLIAEPSTLQLVRDASRVPLTRLRLIDHVAALLAQAGRGELEVWAVAGLLVPALREASTRIAGDAKSTKRTNDPEVT